MSVPFPHVQRHTTINKNVLSVSLNKTFPSFLLFLLTAQVDRLIGALYHIRNIAAIRGDTGQLLLVSPSEHPNLHETHVHRNGREEGNVFFNYALNTFYLRLYGVRHMVKDYSDSERGNPLPSHGLLFPISSKGSFICIIPQTG